ncbi:ammonium transporter [Prochlorothrix hollandica]|uniref:ammonium transporter n=1 Tax=Prochlorothrix hollandica TaxID=1223 RepID=UPI001930AF52|nr:ammonium transporter [Prochlorothrix hollandica]
MSHMADHSRTPRDRRQHSGAAGFDADAIVHSLRQFLPRFQWAWVACVPLTALIVIGWGLAAHAQDAPEMDPMYPIFLLNNLWVFVGAILVIFMNAGFGMLETGLCRQKNAVNVLSKNLIVFTLATAAYWFIGYSLMYGEGNGWFHFDGLFFDPSFDEAEYIAEAKLVPSLDFLFQAAFAGTSATIVSGAVAERIKFTAFLIFSLVLTGFIYPIAGGWQWNGGWLNQLGFYDFAGSTLVHSVGGWAALTGAFILGPRLGKYSENGTPQALPGHNLSIATLGCLILWIGWFGFNPGSQLAMDSEVPYIAVTTNLAGAAGGIAATATSWFTAGKPDLSMTINGILAGLVGVTAGCSVVGMGGAFIIGFIAGILVVFSVYTFDSLKIDDPVGATSVHLVNGVWGTLAVGLFANGHIEGMNGLLFGGGMTQLIHQFIGVFAYGIWTLITTAGLWYALQATVGIRVEPEEEKIGLDVAEHDMEAYSGFLKDSSGVGISE